MASRSGKSWGVLRDVAVFVVARVPQGRVLGQPLLKK